MDSGRLADAGDCRRLQGVLFVAIWSRSRPKAQAPGMHTAVRNALRLMRFVRSVRRLTPGRRRQRKTAADAPQPLPIRTDLDLIP